LLIGCFLAVSTAFAGNPPAAPKGLSPAKCPQRTCPPRFYGYVPPPPIRDTWPGGYKVIMHELREIMLNHIQGHY
jgi:hypothetical protein